MSGKLSAPRDAALDDVRAALLKERLKLTEEELLEYARFYSTSDWRTLRARVISRDGKVCQNVG